MASRINKKLMFIEFLIIGVLIGITEDILAIAFATDAKINLKVFGIVVLIAIPFAILSELVVDRPRFWEKIFNFLGIKGILEKKGEVIEKGIQKIEKKL